MVELEHTKYEYGPPPPLIPSSHEKPNESRFSLTVKQFELFLLKQQFEAKQKELERIQRKEYANERNSRLEYSMRKEY